jgi:hypothetical protein
MSPSVALLVRICRLLCLNISSVALVVSYRELRLYIVMATYCEVETGDKLS